MLRIGNAAGEAHPILGEGISMALQSAGLLCAELLAGGVPGSVRLAPAGSSADAAWHAGVARRYARQWRRQFTSRLHLGAVIAHLAMRPGTARLMVVRASGGGLSGKG